MSTTPAIELDHPALQALCEKIAAEAAAEDRSPSEELDGTSDSFLTARYYGYLVAGQQNLTGAALHRCAFLETVALESIGGDWSKLVPGQARAIRIAVAKALAE
ncbi:hypothetical protein P3T27_007554 [Kitasatospora sp. MAA19]|uniref:hypothetical protein n=1 Tax=unclassified Kitasatospora TaxID=2633591 RepID=UPI002475FD75|nr:hypothetical protein [Kitasatospora sp. MAA19]MDH6710803.1 hypothetical protein [Kitasatospora sp. MAA19]